MSSIQPYGPMLATKGEYQLKMGKREYIDRFLLERTKRYFTFRVHQQKS